MAKRIKKPLNIFISSIVILILFLICMLLFIGSRPGENILTEYLESYLKDMLEQNVQIDNIET